MPKQDAEDDEQADSLPGTVVQGDAFEALTELEADSAHAAVVDFPWEFDAENGNERYSYNRDEDSVEDALFAMEGDNRLPELLTELARVLVDSAWIIFMADDEFQDPVRDALRDSAFTFRRNWAWTPESMGMGYYGRVDHYPMPVATLGDTDRYVSDRSTLFRVPGGRQTDYPTGKPVDLYRQLLRPPVIEDGERLLEPFCGSGPGAAVAAERGLGYWGCDVSETATETARDRLETPRLTGQTTIADGGTREDGQDEEREQTDQETLTETDVEALLNKLADSPNELALRRIIPDPKYSDRRHEFVGFDGDWHSGSITETQRSCILSERYRHRSGLTGVPKEQIDVVSYEKTPFRYWTADLVRVQCPNCPDVGGSVNEMLLSKDRHCAKCGAEVTANA